MTDEPTKITNVTLEAEHTPEQHYTRNTDGSVTEQSLPGTVTVYLVFDGGRIPFTQIDGGRVLEALDAAKTKKASKKDAEPAAESEPDTETA